jgi:hypothetical protein
MALQDLLQVLVANAFLEHLLCSSEEKVSTYAGPRGDSPIGTMVALYFQSPLSKSQCL